MSTAIAAEGAETIRPEAIQLRQNSWVPNNLRLPILLDYRALPSNGRQEMASGFEGIFERMASHLSGGTASTATTITIPQRGAWARRW